MTETPATMTHVRVVSSETVRLDLVIYAFNDLEVKCRDVMNDYNTTPIEEKVWTTLGLEFGNDAGKWALIVRTLYGLKSFGAAFCSQLGRFMQIIGYEHCYSDPDLWKKGRGET